MEESQLTKVFEMLVERISNIEAMLSNAETQRRFDMDRDKSWGKEVDGSLYDWRRAMICKQYSGMLKDDDFVAVTVQDSDGYPKDFQIFKRWARGDLSWLDASLRRTLGDKVVESIKSRVDSIVESRVDDSQDIYCGDIDSIETIDLKAPKTASLDLTLVRVAFQEMFKGSVMDVSYRGIFVKLMSPQETRTRFEQVIKLAKSAFDLLLDDTDEIRVDVYKIEPWMRHLAFDPYNRKRSEKEMREVVDALSKYEKDRIKVPLRSLHHNSAEHSFFDKNDLLVLLNL